MKKESGERETYIPFAAAAQITHLSEKRIRNWLDNGHVRLDADDNRPDASKHRRFSPFDLVRLALVGRLTGIGLSAHRASLLIEDHIQIQALMAKKRGQLFDFLSKKSITVYFYEYDLAENDEEPRLNLWLHSNTEDPFIPKDQDGKEVWGKIRPDTRAVIEVWRIVNEINKRLQEADLL
jgi:DNA-binding transcriptional MerR regulator